MSGTAFSLGQYNEVLVPLELALPNALKGLDPKQVIKSLKNRGEELSRLLRGDIEGLMKFPIFSRDMRKERWELIEDVSEPGEIVIANLETLSFLKTNKGDVSGDGMRQRAVELGANLSQRHAEFLLEHQQEIPKEWREYYLVFPGTVWCDSDGFLLVPYLRWRGERWNLCFYWLGRVWSSGGRLLRPRK